MKRSSASIIKKNLALATNNIVDTITDAVLYITFNTLTGIGTRTTKDADYSMYQADILLSRYNSKTIRKSLNNLISRQYLKRNKTKDGITLTITREGMKRISERIPSYKETRPWDGYLYLVSYDIPIKSNAKRNILREYLRRIGCGKLQDSLWMTPYNPTEIVHVFVDEQNIPGTILVSKLGKDGAIGDEDRKNLIARVYAYKTLTDRYEEFINTYTNQKYSSPTQYSIEYYSILKDDPQLPFALEPNNFPAQQAHRLFQSFFHR